MERSFVKNERCFFSEKEAQISKEYRGLSGFHAGICHRLKRKKCRVMPPIEKEEKPEKAQHGKKQKAGIGLRKKERKCRVMLPYKTDKMPEYPLGMGSAICLKLRTKCRNLPLYTIL